MLRIKSQDKQEVKPNLVGYISLRPKWSCRPTVVSGSGPSGDTNFVPPFLKVVKLYFSLVNLNTSTEFGHLI